jgi:hypothetical protein
VIICDLRSDQLLDVLPVTGLSFDDYIGKTGTCSGTIEVTDARVAARMRANVVPARTAMYIVRGRDVWWGGILWTATPSTDGRGFVNLQFQASTFDSYFAHRLIFETLTFVGEDQLEIARKLLDYAQNQTGGDIGVTYEETFSLVGRDRTYLSYDLMNVRDQLDLLSQVDGGFEWRIRAYSSSDGRRVREMQLGYPKIEVGSNDLVLTSPGHILTYSLPTDGTTTANFWQSRGATTNQDASEDSIPLMSQQYVFPDDLDTGWPRMDGSSDYNTVTDLATLNTHAVADIKRYRRPMVIPDITILLGDNVTPALLGTTARVRIKDIWYSEGASFRYRIIGFKVTPPERGKPETAQLFLEETD